jgi:hypothetical protein
VQQKTNRRRKMKKVNLEMKNPSRPFAPAVVKR